MRGDKEFAGGERKVHLPDQIDDFVDCVFITDVDEDELAAVLDQVNVDAEPMPGLAVEFDDVREQIPTRRHDFPSAAFAAGFSKMIRCCQGSMSSVVFQTSGWTDISLTTCFWLIL